MDDLFSDYRSSKSTRKGRKRSVVAEGVFISPEMFVGAVILFIIGLVLAFSIGVEQGKRISASDRIVKTESSAATRTEKATQVKKKKKRYTTSQKAKPKAQKAKDTGSARTREVGIPSGRYAVQLVVYKDKKYAEKELEYLGNQKYPFFKEEKNGKIIICAGPFKTIEEAKKVASRLRSRYKDCFVKLLKKR